MLYGCSVFTSSTTAIFLQNPVRFVNEGGYCMEVAVYLPSLQLPFPYNFRVWLLYGLHCIYHLYNSHLLTTSDSICSGEWLLYEGYTVFTPSATAILLQNPVPFVQEGGYYMEVALYLPSLQQPSSYNIQFHLFRRVAVVGKMHCIYPFFNCHLPATSRSICS